MKKLLAAVLTLALVFLLVGCGGDAPVQKVYMPREEVVEPAVYEDIPEEPPEVEQAIEQEKDIAPNELDPQTLYEIRDMLNSIPYAGMELSHMPDWLDRVGQQPIVNNETALELADFIFSMNGWWLPHLAASFSIPEDAPPIFVFSRTYSTTNPASWAEPEWSGVELHPELRARLPFLQIPHVAVLHSHMEQTARELFGVELEIYPYALSASSHLFHTFNLFGVYMHIHDGWGAYASRVPIILSYEYMGGRYEVACVFVWISDDSFSPESVEGWEFIPMCELLTYLQTTTAIHTITLLRNQSGGFYYHAHILPG